MHSLL